MRYIFPSILLLLFLVNTVHASSFNVVGSVRYGNYEDEISVNSIEVRVHKVGDERVWQGALSKDGDRVNFNFPIDDLSKNDQLIVTGEVNSDNDVNSDGYFGGVTTVLTDREVSSGLVGELVLDINPIPVPEFDSMTEKSIKICWKGMGDFSVIGYEVLRSNELFGDWESVGNSGQSSNKQVCYTDVDVVTKETYYYRLGVMTSWSAGGGKEYFISKSFSKVSDGIDLGVGVTDKREVEKEETVTDEEDMTTVFESDSSAKQKLKGFWDVVLGWWDKVAVAVESSNYSWQSVIIAIISIALVLVLLLIFLTITFDNTTSKGSQVWADGDLDLDKLKEGNEK